MKYLFMWDIRLLWTSLLFSLLIGACSKEDNTVYPFAEVNQPATYSGGLSAFNKDVMKSLKEDMKAGIILKPDSSQQLFVQLVVDRNGQIDVSGVISTSSFTQEEELRLSILKTSKWSPAIHQGKPVAVSMQLPLKLVGSNGDKDYKNQCVEIARNQNLDNGYILVIPQDGCSGCIRSSIDFAVKNSINESLLTIFTGFQSTKDVLIFQQNHAISSENNFVFDTVSVYAPYLPDRLFPLVIRIENEEVSSYEVLSGSIIKKSFEEIQSAIQ